jgi:hypothetical protein
MAIFSDLVPINLSHLFIEEMWANESIVAICNQKKRIYVEMLAFTYCSINQWLDLPVAVDLALAVSSSAVPPFPHNI